MVGRMDSNDEIFGRILDQDFGELLADDVGKDERL